ncbi:hypothetical protein HPB52_019839 [Rhipicephalus sanguineus]|uniref:Uncharacterized protein n=1 Tax=Rhipicephalus sanguineus TaxID=34632 RepID=A0A9D4T4A9_RHISA|nr:hypothetical protein HPB52_019839 [Rhipicephalus sanguineus]
MCAAVDATVYDVPLSGAPEQPTDNLHRRSGPQNAFIQPPTMVSSWDDHRYTVPRGRFGDVREAPVCFYCGFRGHVSILRSKTSRTTAPLRGTTAFSSTKQLARWYALNAGHVRRPRLPAKCPQ